WAPAFAGATEPSSPQRRGSMDFVLRFIPDQRPWAPAFAGATETSSPRRRGSKDFVLRFIPRSTSMNSRFAGATGMTDMDADEVCRVVRGSGPEASTT